VGALMQYCRSWFTCQAGCEWHDIESFGVTMHETLTLTKVTRALLAQDTGVCMGMVPHPSLCSTKLTTSLALFSILCGG
jgi:hypothetical protein